MKDHLLRVLDDVPPTHALFDPYVPVGEIWQRGGYVFVPNEIARGIGKPDDTVTFGDCSFPAWRLDTEIVK